MSDCFFNRIVISALFPQAAIAESERQFLSIIAQREAQAAHYEQASCAYNS